LELGEFRHIVSWGILVFRINQSLAAGYGNLEGWECSCGIHIDFHQNSGLILCFKFSNQGLYLIITS